MAKKMMKWLNKLSLILVIVGAINWGLVQANVNLVTAILGTMPTLVSIVYWLVGLSGVYQLIKLFWK